MPEGYIVRPDNGKDTGMNPQPKRAYVESILLAWILAWAGLAYLLYDCSAPVPPKPLMHHLFSSGIYCLSFLACRFVLRETDKSGEMMPRHALAFVILMVPIGIAALAHIFGALFAIF